MSVELRNAASAAHQALSLVTSGPDRVDALMIFHDLHPQVIRGLFESHPQLQLVAGDQELWKKLWLRLVEDYHNDVTKAKVGIPPVSRLRELYLETRLRLMMMSDGHDVKVKVVNLASSGNVSSAKGQAIRAMNLNDMIPGDVVYDTTVNQRERIQDVNGDFSLVFAGDGVTESKDREVLDIEFPYLVKLLGYDYFSYA